MEPAAIRNQTALLLPAAVLKIRVQIRTAARKIRAQIRTAAQEAAIRTPEQVLIAAITKRYSADKKHWQSAGSDREWQGCMIRKGPHPVPAHIKDGGK